MFTGKQSTEHQSVRGPVKTRYSAKYKPAYPGLHRRQTLRLGRVCGDRVEDVDQDEEEGDEQRHPACPHQYKSVNNSSLG